MSLAGASSVEAGDTLDGPKPLPTVVIEATAIPGSVIDLDKIPGNVQTLYSADLTRSGAASLTAALTTRLGSVSANDNLDDPFQPDILYRGFEASPVLGTPQGLAVYQNGVRINEAFGDTVNWDLIPALAIQRVDIVSSNPVYGLNALGGALTVRMKNGFDAPGAQIEPSGGSFGQRGVAAEYGASSEHFGIYSAGRALDESGWRRFSSDSLRQLYAVVSARSAGGTLDLSYGAADNHLNGQGSAPVQELAVSRSLVFTGPQANTNRLQFVTLNGTLRVTNGWSFQGVLYDRQFQQAVANGNTTDYTACAGPAGNPAGSAALTGSLCQSDGLTPVTNATGAPLPDLSAGGRIPIGENDFETIHAYGRGAALQTADDESLGGHANHLTAGVTVDEARVHFYSGTQIGVIDPQLLVLPSNEVVYTPENSTAGAAFGATPVSLGATDKDYGFYATDTFDLTQALSLTASGRYNVAFIDLEDDLGTNLSGGNRYRHFNPGFGGTYRLLPTLTVYAGLAVNTRTPTASEIECSNPAQPCLLPSNLAGDPPTLRQVVSHTSEFGVRQHLHADDESGGELSWNLGVFRTGLHDDIYGIATSVSSGFFQNIGDTRRQGIEAGLSYRSRRWSAYANYSYVEADFESVLTVSSPSNPYQDVNGNVQVTAGDRLPGIPRHRLKLGADATLLAHWTVGATLSWVSDQYYFGDESNQLAPLPGYHLIGLHSAYQVDRRLQIFVSLENVLNSKYSTYGILSDPTGVGAPGVPADGVTHGPGVDNRFQSPAPPFAIFGGVRITLE
jgi:iron complex outermembrane receptor protein